MSFEWKGFRIGKKAVYLVRPAGGSNSILQFNNREEARYAMKCFIRFSAGKV